MQKLNLNFQTINANLNANLNVNLYDWQLGKIEDEIVGQLAYNLRASVVMERQNPYSYKVPISAWEFLKQDYAPKWFLKKWPVKYKVTTIDIKTIYPMIKTTLPAKMIGPVVTVLINDTPSFSFLENGIQLDDWNYKVRELNM